jgi:hypothetical protein
LVLCPSNSINLVNSSNLLSTFNTCLPRYKVTILPERHLPLSEEIFLSIEEQEELVGGLVAVAGVEEVFEGHGALRCAHHVHRTPLDTPKITGKGLGVDAPADNDKYSDSFS